MTLEQQIEAAFAVGDHETAANLAPGLADPVAYRRAMERAFVLSSQKTSPRDFSENDDPRQETTMLSFKNQTMKLTSVNVRRELAGKNPEDGRKASDLQLVVKGGNDLLDKLSPHLRGSFYQADVDKQGVLVPHALTKRIHPLLNQEALVYDLKLAGYKVTIDHTGNDDGAIVLEECQVNNFRLRLEEGGTVAIAMRVQYHPTPGQLDPLSDKLQQDVTVTMDPPKVPKSTKRQRELGEVEEANA